MSPDLMLQRDFCQLIATVVVLLRKASACCTSHCHIMSLPESLQGLEGFT